MGLALAHGGHLTHGHAQADKDGNIKKLNASSHYFTAESYYANEETGLIDYEAMAAKVKEFQPKLLIVGASAYPQDFDYAKFREAADSVGAYLMCDMAHYSGLIATGLMNSPFDHCDIVTSTTHKSLRGPRSGMIFSKMEHKDKINFAVFPMLQGGPHNVAIAALAAQFKEVATPEFHDYSKQVVANSKALAAALMSKGEKVISNGTCSHMVMWDLRQHGITGSKIEKIMDVMHMTTNKNSMPGDKNYINPGGIRLGTGALTTRGMVEKDMEKIAEYLLESVKMSARIQEKVGKKLVDFVAEIEKDEEVLKFGEEIKVWALTFAVPGV
jgi:glycine hydroxymethyltransferase